MKKANKKYNTQRNCVIMTTDALRSLIYMTEEISGELGDLRLNATSAGLATLHHESAHRALLHHQVNC